MNDYKINENNVATDPDMEVLLNTSQIRISIALATDGQTWTYGYDFKVKIGSYHGSGAGAGFGKYRAHMQFPTRSAARKAAILHAVKFVQNEHNKISKNKIIAALTAALNPQLSLF